MVMFQDQDHMGLREFHVISWLDPSQVLLLSQELLSYVPCSKIPVAAPKVGISWILLILLQRSLCTHWLRYHQWSPWNNNLPYLYESWSFSFFQFECFSSTCFLCITLSGSSCITSDMSRTKKLFLLVGHLASSWDCIHPVNWEPPSSNRSPVNCPPRPSRDVKLPLSWQRLGIARGCGVGPDRVCDNSYPTSLPYM